MSTNMTLITSVTVGSGGAASVTLPATGTIPQTYTDLKIVISARTNRSSAVDAIGVYYNGDTTSARYTAKQLTGTGSGTQSTSYNPYNDENMYVSGASATASTFGNSEIYIPNYTGSNQKSASTDSVGENNATLAYSNMGASLYNQTTAITTISFIPITGTTILEGSTFYLYGISNVTSTTKATGGIVSSDGTYNYHMFPYSGTFTPTQNITADYLVIAGGGGGGAGVNTAHQRGGGGGGAGGLLYGTGQSLTGNTNYTITVGAGGAGGASSTNNGAQGGTSSFSSFSSATGGGYGGGNDNVGGNGGSGGGGAADTSGGNAGGTGTSGEGNNGGTSASNAGGGGGGKGNAGANATATGGGAGGAGINTYSSWANATQTGVNGYYAGGGGGGDVGGGGAPGAGGLGGGATGAESAVAAINAIANTGGGGGGGAQEATLRGGSNGGSGLVIIRYAI